MRLPKRTMLKISIFSCFISSLLFFYSSPKIFTPLSFPANYEAPLGYIVHSTNCKIVEMNPWDPSTAKFVKSVRTEPHRCPRAIVTVSSKDKVFEFDKSDFHYKTTTCCYRTIQRVTEDPKNYTSKADQKLRRSGTCQPISKSPDNPTMVTSEFVQIECKYKLRLKQLTKDFQAIILPPSVQSTKTWRKVKFWRVVKESINKKYRKQNVSKFERKFNNKNNKKKFVLPPSVLIIGIDSVSRLHMTRSLPKTRTFLEENDFIEMKGYTKIGDNTFPNLMAALGEMNERPCFHNRSEKLDDCPLIWKNFSSRNYITGLVEDRPGISIFNFMKTGFVQQPTDYYLRPITIAYRNNLKNTNDCVGGLSQTDFLIKYINDFLDEIREKIPYFLVNWFTSISHDEINELKTADTNFRDLLSNAISKSGKNTVIIFMSDHGYRYGGFRETPLGYYEVSLPTFFIRIPPSIKAIHPEWYSNLRVNSHRLTSPYDVHATLENILSLSSSFEFESTTTTNNDFDPFGIDGNDNDNANDKAKAKASHKKVYSFFENHPQTRTCDSSGIPSEYCRCNEHSVGVDSSMIDTFSFGHEVIAKVNAILEKEIRANKCIVLTLRKLLYVRELLVGNDNNADDGEGYKDYLVAVGTSPPAPAHFESKVRMFKNGTIVVVGTISRINSYEGHSSCVKEYSLKNYCVCKDYVDIMLGRRPIFVG